MSQFLLVAAVALTVGVIGFGVAVLITGDDRGLEPTEPDGRAIPLPADRPLAEPDLAQVRFDTAVRGYRMAQVDAAVRRTAYDLGYKDELIKVLQAEVDALREGRLPDAEVLRRAREASLAPRDRPAHPPPALAPAPQPAQPPALPHPAPARPVRAAELPEQPDPEQPDPDQPDPDQPVQAAAELPEQPAGDRQPDQGMADGGPADSGPADARSGGSDAPVSGSR